MTIWCRVVGVGGRTTSQVNTDAAAEIVSLIMLTLVAEVGSVGLIDGDDGTEGSCGTSVGCTAGSIVRECMTMLVRN